MRVLHITHQYAPAIGGSERYFTDLSEELVRRGHTVHVATTRSREIQSWRNELPPRQQINGVTVWRFDGLKRGRLGWHALRLGNQGRRVTGSRLFEPLILFGNGPVSPGLALHVLRHAHDYDLIHIQTLPFAHTVYAYLCARAARRPVVITPHIHVEYPDAFDLASFGAVLRGADAILAVSEREIPYLQQRGVREERITVGGNGVDVSTLPRLDRLAARARLSLPPDGFILLYLGRKEPYKGLPSVINAFRALQPRYAALHLVSAGPPSENRGQLAAERGRLLRWTDIDAVDHAAKVDLLNACDALVLPSKGEAFGIVFLEAWIVGKPVIGARAGAIPWVITDGEDGLLAEPDDDADLASKIERLLVSPELCRRLGRRGEMKVRQHYTIGRVADRVECTYRRVVKCGANAYSSIRRQ